jgi:hypothetical protein
MHLVARNGKVDTVYGGLTIRAENSPMRLHHGCSLNGVR